MKCIMTKKLMWTNCFVQNFGVKKKKKMPKVFATDCEQAFCWPRHLKPTLLLIRPKQAEGIMGISSTTKLPSHLDDSQPQSTFSIGTEPGEQGSTSR